MGLFTNQSNKNTFPWIELISMDQWNDLWENPSNRPVVVFKHSTRCSVSAMALRFFEANKDLNEQKELYLLDLLAHRNISNAIEFSTGVEHQSPQVLVFLNKEILYHSSHQSIDADKVKNILKEYK